MISACSNLRKSWILESVNTSEGCTVGVDGGFESLGPLFPLPQGLEGDALSYMQGGAARGFRDGGTLD